VRIFGISRDSPYSHYAYAARQSLTFPLLSDWNGDAVRAFGVAQVLDGLDDVPRRTCFLIDGDGVVRFARMYRDEEVPDLDEVLAGAREL
jgi:peroxiredoxin